MLFAAKVIEKRTIGQTLIKITIICFVFILVSTLIPGLQGLTIFFFIALLLIIGICAIVYKGNLSTYTMTNDLLIFLEEMQICRIVFPLDDVKDLKFVFHSFNDSTTENEQSMYGGIDNKIKFTYRKQAFEYQFFLQSKSHYLQFVAMLEQLYQARVVFEETNSAGRTFMMKNVNDSEYYYLMLQYQDV